jgi:hypothetical protein
MTGWTLTDVGGDFLAGHEVRLDPAAERFDAFTGLYDYVSWQAAPDSPRPKKPGSSPASANPPSALVA